MRGNRGLTLLEVVVYVGILAVVIVFVVSGLVSLNSGVVDVRVSRNLNRHAHTAMERVLRESRDALGVDKSVTEPEYQGLVATALALRVRDGEDISTTKLYTDEEGVLFIEPEGQAALALTPSEIIVEDISFTKLVTNHSETVRVYLRISDRDGRVSGSRETRGSAVMRGSY